MLVQFSVGNYLSFKNIITFSMVGSHINEHENNNVFAINNKLKLLKSGVVYGANASGKSNLFKAMNFVREFVLSSSKDTQATEKIEVTNFKLSTETENEPCFFEIIFIQEGIRYRYGFQLDKDCVHKEWFFFAPKRQEAKLFLREKDKYTLGTYFKEGKGIEKKTRENALFLSVVAQFNGKISTSVLEWFRKFRIISGIHDNEQHKLFTVTSAMKNEKNKYNILKLLKEADSGIEDLTIKETPVPEKDLSEKELSLLASLNKKTIVTQEVNTKHKKYDQENKFLSLEDFNINVESEGTKKMFSISGPVLDTLSNGYILVVDELDARLHPLLTRFLIRLFNSKNNTTNAQLIFASHDTSFLDKTLFRRDQIWFTEKNKFGETDLYSLVEYKRAVRNDEAYGKNYILGKYGAIPYIKEERFLE